MNGAEVLDEYLEGLLKTAADCAPLPPSSAVAGAATADAPISAIAADVISEMLADPAFADVAAATGDEAVAAPPSPAPTPLAETDRIAAELIAEMEADPAFAITAAPTMDSNAAAVLAEMEDDPAFASPPDGPASVTGGAGEQRGAPSPPPPPPAPRAIAPLHSPPAGKPLPRHIQALFQASNDLPAQIKSSNDHSSRWLRLRCGEQTYALELLKVQEVVLPTPLLRLRGTERAMLGIMNLRGLVVPVLDLSVYLGSEPVADAPATRVVVLEENAETMGLRVSAVEDVTTLTVQQIEPPDTTRLCKISNNLFRGVARTGRQTMILLDASQLLH